MNRHDTELHDVLEDAARRRTRKRATPRAQSNGAVRAQVKIADDTYLRVRGACCEFSGGIDLDEHAALVTLDVLNARAVPRGKFAA